MKKETWKARVLAEGEYLEMIQLQRRKEEILKELRSINSKLIKITQ
ncbi:MAG: hypothetical protein KAS07_05815 [Candidatus Pacebacteria bacterium]|nr:hypothetical protein [Candidatus Paceibacterota bacterium]